MSANDRSSSRNSRKKEINKLNKTFYGAKYGLVIKFNGNESWKLLALNYSLYKRIFTCAM